MRTIRLHRRLVSGKSIIGALVLSNAMWPVPGMATEDFFVCTDSQGLVEYIKVDYAAWRVSETGGEPGQRCIGTFVNGRFSTVLSSPPGEECSFLALRALTNSPQPTVHQWVTITDNKVRWGTHGQPSDVNDSLDLKTGIFDDGSGYEQCHRPHAD